MCNLWEQNDCGAEIKTIVGVGAILIAPLVKHYHTRSVLAIAVFGFGLVTAILLICDGVQTLFSLLSTTPLAES